MDPADLHWTESDIESISVSGRELSVVARNVFVRGDPAARRVRVTFEGVASARRKITEYIGDPKSPRGFAAPYVVKEMDDVELPGARTYALEGISVFPPVAWLDLEVTAQGARVEIL